MSGVRQERTPRFWLPFAAWAAIFAIVCATVTLIADFHMYWGRYPWMDLTSSARRRRFLISYLIDSWFYIPIIVCTIIYSALLLLALLPFRRNRINKALTTLRIISNAAICTTLSLAAGRLIHGMQIHFALIRPPMAGAFSPPLYPWLDFPSFALFAELTTLTALFAIITLATLSRRNRERFTPSIRVAVICQWVSLGLAMIYAIWWIFDGAINERISLLAVYTKQTSSFLRVADPWNYHHNGLVFAAFSLVFFTGYRLFLRRAIARRRAWLQTHCGTCSYDLTGISSVCPECGTALTPRTS